MSDKACADQEQSRNIGNNFTSFIFTLEETYCPMGNNGPAGPAFSRVLRNFFPAPMAPPPPLGAAPNPYPHVRSASTMLAPRL